MSDDITANDTRRRRCPMLGHDLAFSYCRAPGADVPCRKIFDCWWNTFDVTTFIRSHYGEEGIRRILAPPKEKVLTLADLIKKAREGDAEES
jgi:hypothetical protein